MADGHGLPLGVAIEGANRNDMKLFVETLLSMPVKRPSKQRSNICLDAGYDYDVIFEQAARLGLVPHIVPNWYNRKWEAKPEAQRQPGKKARRWVVERLHSWLNRYRHLLVRWDKKAENYLAMLHFAFAHILYKQSKKPT